MDAARGRAAVGRGDPTPINIFNPEQDLISGFAGEVPSALWTPPGDVLLPDAADMIAPQMSANNRIVATGAPGAMAERGSFDEHKVGCCCRQPLGTHISGCYGSQSGERTVAPQVVGFTRTASLLVMSPSQRLSSLTRGECATCLLTPPGSLLPCTLSARLPLCNHKTEYVRQCRGGMIWRA